MKQCKMNIEFQNNCCRSSTDHGHIRMTRRISLSVIQVSRNFARIVRD